MIIQTLKRPWLKEENGNRNSDSWYQTREWKTTRQSFINSPPHISLPPINGKQYSNAYCVECWRSGKITPTHTIDHIVCIKDGGSRTDFNNMQGLCESHNATKTAIDGNNRRKKK